MRMLPWLLFLVLLTVSTAGAAGDAGSDGALALTEAERTAAAEQGREQRRRFLTPGSGYQAGSARMFNGN